jgi:hypothetical protein
MFGIARIIKIILAPLSYILILLYLSMIRVRVSQEDVFLRFVKSGRKGIAAI